MPKGCRLTSKEIREHLMDGWYLTQTWQGSFHLNKEGHLKHVFHSDVAPVIAEMSARLVGIAPGAYWVYERRPT